MPLVLTSSKKDEIFRSIRKAFSDFRFFDDKIAPCIHQLIEKSTLYDFDTYFMNDLMDYCLGHSYQNEYSDSKEKKDILATIRIILHATVIHLFSLNPIVQDRLFSTTDELLHAYPSFVDQLMPLERPDHVKELNNLLIFRNYMTVALLLLPAKENKIFLLRVLERLEGSNEQYITGTGQKPSTTRRCEIFHQESGTEVIKKRPRKPKTDQGIAVTTTPAKTKKSSTSAKRSKTCPAAPQVLSSESSEGFSIGLTPSHTAPTTKRGRKRNIVETIPDDMMQRGTSSNKFQRISSIDSSPRSISAMNNGISPRPLTLTIPSSDNHHSMETRNHSLWQQKQNQYYQQQQKNNITVTTNQFNKDDSYMELLPPPADNNIYTYKANNDDSITASSSSPLMMMHLPPPALTTSTSSTYYNDVLLFSTHPSPLQKALLKNIDNNYEETYHHHGSLYPPNVVIVNPPPHRDQSESVLHSSSLSSSPSVSSFSLHTPFSSFPLLPPPTQSVLPAMAVENHESMMYHLLLDEPYQGSFTEDIRDVFFP